MMAVGVFYVSSMKYAVRPVAMGDVAVRRLAARTAVVPSGMNTTTEPIARFADVALGVYVWTTIAGSGSAVVVE